MRIWPRLSKKKVRSPLTKALAPVAVYAKKLNRSRSTNGIVQQIYYVLAVLEEITGGERCGEEICHILAGLYAWHDQSLAIDHVADVGVPAFGAARS